MFFAAVSINSSMELCLRNVDGGANSAVPGDGRVGGVRRRGPMHVHHGAGGVGAAVSARARRLRPQQAGDRRGRAHAHAAAVGAGQGARPGQGRLPAARANQRAARRRRFRPARRLEGSGHAHSALPQRQPLQTLPAKHRTRGNFTFLLSI